MKTGKASKIAEEVRRRSLDFYEQWLKEEEQKAQMSKRADDYIMAAVVAKLKSVIEEISADEIVESAKDLDKSGE